MFLFTSNKIHVAEILSQKKKWQHKILLNYTNDNLQLETFDENKVFIIIYTIYYVTFDENKVFIRIYTI